MKIERHARLLEGLEGKFAIFRGRGGGVGGVDLDGLGGGDRLGSWRGGILGICWRGAKIGMNMHREAIVGFAGSEISQSA